MNAWKAAARYSLKTFLYPLKLSYKREIIGLCDPPDWADIARAYDSNKLTVQEICAHFGIGRSALYRRSRLEGWPRRRDRKEDSERKKPGTNLSSGPDDLKKPRQPKKTKAHRQAKTNPNGTREKQDPEIRRHQLVTRLYRALDQKMRIIEDRTAAPEGVSAIESERDARALNSLVRLFEKLVEIDDHTAAQQNPTTRKMKAAPNDQRSGGEQAARLRQDLARRLARLCKGRNG